MRLDIVQISAVLLSIAECLFVLVYFLGYTHAPDTTFVSDLLIQRTEYRVTMTIFVCFQLLFCSMYVFRRRKSHVRETYAMCFFLLLLLVGWTIVCFVPTGDDKLSFAHLMGALFFILGNLFYFSFLIWDAWQLHLTNNTQWSLFMFGAIVFFFLVAVGCGVVFCVYVLASNFDMNVQRQGPCWIYEHLLYVLFALSQTFFYLDDSPNPTPDSSYLFFSLIMPATRYSSLPLSPPPLHSSETAAFDLLDFAF